MALIRARSTETGEVTDVSDAWLERWPGEFVALTDDEPAAERAELQRLADAHAAEATLPEPAAEQPAPAAAPAPEPAPEQPAPRGRF